jgi:hypothetical protein
MSRIVVLHGMNPRGNEGHEENTWTDRDTGTNWIKTLLPQQTPNARILTFHYNSNVAFGLSMADQARNLLGCLGFKREVMRFSTHEAYQPLNRSYLQSNPTRPIIWIAHSLGGIIVKEALVIAYDENQAYPTISTLETNNLMLQSKINSSRVDLIDPL